MDRVGVPLIREVPDYVIEGDCIIVSIAGRAFCAMPIRNFQQGAAKAAKAITEHYAKQAKVLPFRRAGIV